MKRSDWPVTEDDVRPAGEPDHCFYCDQPLGGQHHEDCVIRKRTIVVAATITLVIDVPECWDERQIDFYHNEGTWCSSNLIDDLVEFNEKNEDECYCNCMLIGYLREATEEDEARYPVLADD